MPKRIKDHKSHLSNEAPCPAPGEQPEQGLVTTEQLAEQLGVSRQTVDRRRREGHLKGVPFGRGFGFRRTETIEVGDLRKPTSAVARFHYEGDRDARVLEMLERSATVAEVVIETKTPIDVVIRLRQTWRTAREAERREVTTVCGCGALSDPSTARCVRCFSRARVLSIEQLAILAGRPTPPPNTCTCRGCSRIVALEDADHLCVKCTSRLAVAIRGGALVIVLADIVVRPLTADEIRELTQHLVQQVPPAPSPPRPPSLEHGPNRPLPEGQELFDLIKSLEKDAP